MPDSLERRLAALAPEIDLPPTPDLAPAVLARIAERPPRRLAVPARRTLLVAAALMALLAAGAGAVPAVREAVRDLLGIDGATVERVPELPAAPGGLDLGHPATLEDDVGFEIVVPHEPSLGRPDAVYRRGRPPFAQLTLAYRPARGLPELRDTGFGLLLTQFRGGLEPDLVQKLVGPGTDTRRVNVGSAPGFWVGGSHTFAYRDGEGEVRTEDRRLATNTLLWRRAGLLLRLEGNLPLRRALEIAESVR